MGTEKKEAKYSFHQTKDGYESGYESEGGTEYVPTNEEYKGSYAKFRRLRRKNDLQHDEQSVVGKPRFEKSYNLTEHTEAQNKQLFFATLYPEREKPVYLPVKPPKRYYFYTDKGKKEAVKDPNHQSYRLILPFIKGTAYINSIILSRKHLRQLFLLAIDALEDCHNKGLVNIDLKADSILYNAQLNKSFLIDGGLSAKIGAIIDRNFCYKNDNDKARLLQHSTHIAPECWHSQKESEENCDRIKATASMDIFAFGALMKFMCVNAGYCSIAMKNIIESCMNPDPKTRPSLVDLREKISNVLLKSYNMAQFNEFFGSLFITEEFAERVRNNTIYKELQMIC